MDDGEERTIHPSNKEIVGKRFAYLALGDSYGYKGFAYQSPSYESLSVSGNVATIKFKYAPKRLNKFSKAINPI
ncbi:MAG: hypothetical protein WDM90_06840 [Ferruginibacter sp.]